MNAPFRSFIGEDVVGAGCGAVVPQRFRLLARPAILVVRMCHPRSMGGELDDAAAVLAAVAGRPGYARSDDELTATMVDAYALMSQATAFVAALTRDAAGRDLPGRCASSG